MTSWRGPFKAYLFDLDGTLIDTAPDLNVALNHCLSEAGLDPVDEALTRHWVGHGARVMIEAALEHQRASRDVQPLFDAFIDYYADHSAVLSRPYSGVIETLDTLQARGARLAVVTNKLAHLSERLLADIGMRQHFDVVVGGDSTPNPKPHPAPIRLACKELAVEMKNALFVGDSRTDVDAARNARMKVVCMRDGYNQGTDVTTLGADGVIDTFHELVR